MPTIKKGTVRLTDNQVKSAQSAKGGLQGQDAGQVDLVVQAMCEALPDRRGTECNRLRHLINDPGGKVTVWDQLGRRREDYGPKAGLVALIEMMGANSDQFMALGQEPSSSVLASMCTQNSRANDLSKEKFVMKRLMGVIGDAKVNEPTRKNTSWVLRRVCEVSPKMRTELGSDRVMLQILGKVMRCEPLDEPSHHGADDNRSSASRPVSRGSFGGTRGVAGVFPRRVPSSEMVGQENTFDQSFTVLNQVTEDGVTEYGGQQGGASRSQAPSPTKGLAPVGQRQQGAPMSVQQSKANNGSSGWHSPGQRVTTPDVGSFFRSEQSLLGGRASPASASARPQTAESGGDFFRGISRPGTGMGTTLLRDLDSMSVQGNVCCAIGNLALSDDVIDRLGKTEGVITGLLFIVENGTEWAAGHAARAIGNVAYSSDNCRALVAIDTSNIAVRSLVDMVSSPHNSQRTKELAIFALANLTRREDVCHRVSGVPGIYATLNALAREGINREDVDRVICNMSQSRLGTRTWRQPKRL